MTNETIADIVREMREYRIDECDRNWCDRIEKAAKREKELSLAICDKCEAGVFKAENDRLRAALKPVLNACVEDTKCDAVREAQRIYKEGEAKK